MLNMVDVFGGGNTNPNCYPKGNEICTDPFGYTMEKFSPPYMQSKIKPEITEAPTTVNYNTEFTFKVKGKATDVSRVTFIRYSSVTHSTNTDQRFVELPILKKKGDVVTVISPWNSAQAPPGNWMLWALDENGTPSESKTILLTLDSTQPFSFEMSPNFTSAKKNAKSDTISGSNFSVYFLLFVISLSHF
jgi:hypothetical protein